MTIDNAIRGNLFAPDFLTEPESIGELPEWDDLDVATLDKVESGLRAVFEAFPHQGTPNESQTEDDLIWKSLYCLDWTAHLRQQNLSSAGRTDVPDGLLFIDDAAKSRAVGIAEERARYAVGAVMVESKRWLRPLGRTSDQTVAPSTQMLRYLRRADDLTEGRMRWGILTNGAHWRLYYQGAGSVAEGFIEVDLAAILNIPGHNDGLFPLSSDERRHCLKLFVLLFGRKAFLAERADGRTLHQRALVESRLYEERVSANISNLVFEEVFPSLVRAIAEAEASVPLSEVRDAALVLLYRLLFLLYAEDRALLPVADQRYDNIGLRRRVRQDVGRRKEQGETFSATATGYYTALDDLSRVIDQGDPAFGLPPYNGGLFDTSRTPLLSRIRLSNRVMAEVIDALSFEQHRSGRRYINYRSLSVQQLGSIYERLLEFEPVHEAGDIQVRPNVFARKGSGSYYTPEPLVLLILEETVGPLADAKLEAFRAKVSDIGSVHDVATLPPDVLAELARVDPAQGLLDLKVCDPAMGSGHFLVSLVDFLSDRVIKALDEANGVEGYVSPLAERIEGIRNTILDNATQNGWSVDPSQLDDEHIVRRMVLKRCVYGVDKNPMAVELAKVSLWLHTFTIGAPLSFLDHHLRCGDSLFGSWVHEGLQRAETQGGELFLSGLLSRAKAAANPMQEIETLSDAEVAETAQSAKLFDDIHAGTAPLDAFLSLLHAFDWLKPDRKDKSAIATWLIGNYGDPIAIAMDEEEVTGDGADAATFAELLTQARSVAKDERFLNWQVAFPGVWTDWENADRQGGFDAVIGNPPWDRVKLQQVEWFASRRREIALAQRASDRKRMIQELQDSGDPLAEDFEHASERAMAMARMARQCGDYPFLSRGDVNLYSLFVERAMALAHSDAVIGLLTPIGIATDKTSSTFFSDRIAAESVRAFYAFENRRGWLFPDIHHEEQPSVLVLSRHSSTSEELDFCARVSSWEQFGDVDRRFPVAARSLASVNPNTGTVPLFRNRRDATLTTAIYEHLPVLVNRSTGRRVWQVEYKRMFDMTNDSQLFRTRQELEEQEGAWPIERNHFGSPSGEWVPLYEGKMVQIYNHRYADVKVNPANVSAQGVARRLPDEILADPTSMPSPRFWVNEENLPSKRPGWRIGFNDICNTNNARSFIAAAVAGDVGCANTLPTISLEPETGEDLALLLANFCSLICDYVARRKVQSRHLNWYIVEQLPVVPPDVYRETRFGPKTAAEIVREAVLELTYTADDMAPFARDLGYVDDDGNVKPPFPWNEDRRLNLRAKLDAVFFHLYGVTDREDIRYVYSTFPIVERQETAAYDRYRSRDLCLSWTNALAAGRPDADVKG